MKSFTNINIITFLLIAIFSLNLVSGVSYVISNSTIKSKSKKFFLIIWQFPKSIFIIAIFSLLINLGSYYINNPLTIEYINNSSAYQTINNNLLKPILNTHTVQKIPFIVNDSLRKTSEDLNLIYNKNIQNYSNSKQTSNQVIQYFNGVPLDEAVISNYEINQKSKLIVGNEKNDRIKAYLIYRWISKNISYDYKKAETIVSAPSDIVSGSIVAFSEKKGVCFDYSCLYISMCRAVDLKVRLITGLGYNRVDWYKHAWNQVYFPEENRWINVDTTFASSGYNYFDNYNFYDDHKNEVIQHEW